MTQTKYNKKITSMISKNQYTLHITQLIFSEGIKKSIKNESTSLT